MRTGPGPTSHTRMRALQRPWNYSDAWPCWSKYPHSSAHLAVGGTVSTQYTLCCCILGGSSTCLIYLFLIYIYIQLVDQAASPGDPLFFLHHCNLDRLWWEWQQQDSPARLTEMSGKSIPALTSLEELGWLYPSAAIMDYDGDAYNTTTLHHNLWMIGLFPNATVGDVMDLQGDLICADYV